LLKVIGNNNTQEFFQQYLSAEEVLEVWDTPKKILVVKFSPGIEKVETLKKSKSLLCLESGGGVWQNHKQGSFRVQCWGVCFNYDVKFRLTAEMKKDLDIINPWLKRNEGRFENVSIVLKMVDLGQDVHL
jgi:hypothetical protein